MSPEESAHFRILKLVEEQPAMSQRDLARELGVSLGKTHYLIKALLEKGLVKANNFRHHGNKLGYAYLLTATGMAAKVRLARSYLEQKEREYDALHNEIESLRGLMARDAGASADRTLTGEHGP